MEFNEPHENPMPPFNPYESQSSTRKALYWVVIIFSVLFIFVFLYFLIALKTLNFFSSSNDKEANELFQLVMTILFVIQLIAPVLTLIFSCIYVRKVGKGKERAPIFALVLNILSLNVVCIICLIIIICQTPKKIKSSEYNQNQFT